MPNDYIQPWIQSIASRNPDTSELRSNETTTLSSPGPP